MKCPKCGKDLLLRNEKVGENEDGSAIYNEFGICKDCKKKFNLDKTRAKKAERAAEKTVAKESVEEPVKKVVKKPVAKEGAPETTRVMEPVKPTAPKKPRPVNAASEETLTSKPVTKKRPAADHLESEKPAQEKVYSNIPPKKVREQAEEDVKKNYDLMLDPEDNDDNEVPSSKLPIIMIILSILIIIAAIAITAFFIL
ncbi:MAG: hypothetical protein K2O96_03885 [Lachnospiraceae bacterium]|nr:hypothetical protein [Lachnospiraceae bacterium]